MPARCFTIKIAHLKCSINVREHFKFLSAKNNILQMKKILIFLLLISGLTARAQKDGFKPLRYDEDYSYLKRDTSSNWYDEMKFQPLSKDKATYLSYGGEVRYQY